MEFVDPRTTPIAPIKRRGELPHLYKEGGCYFTTFRLADAIVYETEKPSSPQEIDAMDPAAIASACEPPIAEGSCALRHPEIAVLVQNALLHFNGERYELIAWCIMPNHVHAIFTALSGHTPGQILHSWKSFTAHRANKLLGRSGAFWERESFDHLIRTADAVERFVAYVEDNPVIAGLCSTPSSWPFSSAGAGFRSPIRSP